MREITEHAVNPANEALKISVLDEPGAGGACHDYAIRWTREVQGGGGAQSEVCPIHFQNGPIREAGINGITQEALLAIVADRLRSFQAGPFACRENSIALACVEQALLHLHNRTRERLARGVEGTHQK